MLRVTVNTEVLLRNILCRTWRPALFTFGHHLNLTDAGLCTGNEIVGYDVSVGCGELEDQGSGVGRNRNFSVGQRVLGSLWKSSACC